VTSRNRLSLLAVMVLLVLAGGGALRAAGENAAPQPIAWRAFDKAAVEAAGKEGKLILMSIQAPWGHLDRVMEEVTFANPAVTALVTERFIAVKEDALRRPDLFARYGVGGWPATAVLLPSGQPLYFPEAGGKLLRAGGQFYAAEPLFVYLEGLSTWFASNREAAEKAADELNMRVLERKEVASAELTPDLLEGVVTRMMEVLEARRGDPGLKAARLPDADSMRLALYYYDRKGTRSVLDIALHTLTDMARGGIRDHLGGGFHRAATDDAWRVPAFEKILSVNAELLEAYNDVYKLSGNGAYLRIAQDIISYVTGVLADPQGWFYPWQAADARVGEDGDYYTWTIEEARAALAALPEDQREAIVAAYDIGDPGEMLDSAPRRNVLYLVEGPKLLAARLAIPEARASEMLEAGRRQLLEARARRPVPPVGRILVVDANAAMAAALIHAGDAWRQSDLRQRGLRCLELLWQKALDDKSGLMDHAWSPESGRQGLAQFFADQAEMVRALLVAYESTGEAQHLDRARKLADQAHKAFVNELDGGWLDRLYDPEAPGLLAWPGRVLRDNATFSESLVRLRYLTGDESYMKIASKALESWADEYGRYKELSSPFGMAAHKLLVAPVEVLVVSGGESAAQEDLAAQARALYAPWKITRFLKEEEARRQVEGRKVVGVDTGTALLCAGTRCAGPYRAADNLRSQMEAFMKEEAAARQGVPGKPPLPPPAQPAKPSTP